jgi:hypothetical protein
MKSDCLSNSITNQPINEVESGKDTFLNNISNIEKQDYTPREDVIRNESNKFTFEKNLDSGDEDISNKVMEDLNGGGVESKAEENIQHLAIASIVPEEKLKSTVGDDIMFQSNVKRLLNQKIKTHVSQNFCDRFAICTRETLKLYKSKEQFLILSRPVNVIPLASIKSVNRFSLGGEFKGNNQKLHFFVIEFHEIPFKGKLVAYPIGHERTDYAASHNKGKISLFGDGGYNKTSESICKVDSDILILATVDEVTANKWVIVLNYFLNKLN